MLLVKNLILKLSKQVLDLSNLKRKSRTNRLNRKSFLLYIKNFGDAELIESIDENQNAITKLLSSSKSH